MTFLAASTRMSLVAIAVAAFCLCAAPRAAAAPLPLGTVTLTADIDPSCPAGQTCQGIEVSCPAVAHPARAFLATATPTGPVRGVVVLASGGVGNLWWSEVNSLAPPFVDSLGADGFVVVQIRWVNPWLESATGEDAGPANLACRPATVVQWVHDNQFAPLGLPEAGVGVCGFCISGNSGGASQVSYAVSMYGLAPILDAVIPTSGPVHAAQAKGCIQNPDDWVYWYDPAYRNTIDSSYGFTAGKGPCAARDAAFLSRWNAESVDTGANDLFYPTTRVVMIVGGADTGYAPAHARDFAVALERAGSPYVGLQTVPDMPHRIQSSASGLSALHDALLARGGEYPRPRGASPLQVALVPAANACTAPNTTHGEPIASGSCAPPTQVSQLLTVGTPDANGEFGGFVASVLLRVVGCSLCETPIDSDLLITASATDVRNRSDMSDYTGELQGRLPLRITDKANTSGPSGQSESGTVEDIPFSFAMSCAGTESGHFGGACDLSTSGNALEPGSVRDGDRAIWQVGPISFLDADGNLFATQGVFVP